MGDTFVEIAGINVTEFRAEGLRLLRKGGAQSCKLVRPEKGARDAATGGVAGTGDIEGATKAISGEVPQSVRELQAMLGGAKVSRVAKPLPCCCP